VSHPENFLDFSLRDGETLALAPTKRLPYSPLVTDLDFMTHLNVRTKLLMALLLIAMTWGIGSASSVGASSPIEADTTTVTEEAKLTASDGSVNDRFGQGAAIDGDTLVIGAGGDSVNGNNNQGSAYVYVRSGTSWTQQAYLTASDGVADDQFGVSVSISGDTIVVGAFADEIGGRIRQGSAYVFIRNEGTWSQQAKLTASDGAENDFFGKAVSLSADTAVVGSTRHTVGGNDIQGATYVFVRNGSTWGQQAELTASDGAAGDNFGNSISVAGDTLVVGAFQDGVGGNSTQGSAYVFARVEGTWSQQAKLTASDGAATDFFGFAVALSGNTVVVGARSHDVGSNFDQGAAYVFLRAGSTWSQQAKLTAVDGATQDLFGSGVAIRNNTIIVGAALDSFDVNRSGSGYVFSRAGSAWSQRAKFAASDGGAFDRFGMAIGFSGDTVVVGAWQHDPGGNLAQGGAWVFRVIEPPPLPVVFVPGVAGSVLIDRNDGNNVLWFANSADDLRAMSRFNTAGDDKVAPDLLRSVFGVKDVYGGFLDGLAAKGFREYDLNTGAVGDFASFSPSRLTAGGCDSGQTDGDGKKPNLFPFPYDWRLDNAVNAEKLDDYIDCVRQIYPDSDVNIITHSMGGLLVRRYVLDNLSDHHVDRWASIAAPWLGAPKLAFVMETGEFLDEIKHIELFKGILRDVLRSFPAVHQLLPSQSYDDLGGVASIQEFGVDLDGDGNEFGLFSGQGLYDLADQRYGLDPFFPGTIAREFHTTAQDDWRADSSGIEFFHLFGEKSVNSTVERFVSKIETVCSIFGFSCSKQIVAEPRFTNGDGTVPRLSAERISGSTNYNTAGATMVPFISSTKSTDDSVDHNGLMANAFVTTSLLDIMAGGDGFGTTEPFSTSASSHSVSSNSAFAAPALPGSQSSVVADAAPGDYHYVKIVGPAEVTVSSGSGGTTAGVNEVFANTVPGVTVLGIGENAFMVLTPAGTAETYDLDFNANGPMSVEVLTGDGTTPDEAIRYQDVNLPDGAAARLSFTLAGARDLSYDSDGNGTFDATSTPTVVLTGAAAADNEGPTITLMSTTTDFTAQVTLSAVDAISGVTDLFYSTDGASFTRYAGPITMDLRASSTIYALANDGAANRSSIARTLAHSVTGSISLQGVEDQGVFAAIGPTVSVDVGGTSTSVAVDADGTFDLSGLVSGTYSVTVQAPGFMPAQRSSVSIAGASVTVPTFELRSGLVDSDGVVSIRDISAIAASFGVTGLTDRLDVQGRIVDLNGSGNVDILDISAAASNFGVVSPQNWN